MNKRLKASWVLFGAVIAIASTGCFEGKLYITSDKSNKVAKLILDSPPSKMDVTLDLHLEDKIVLLGYDVDKARARAGDTVKVTWYWKCLKEPGPGWRLMTHVFDHRGISRLNADKQGPIRKHFQPEHWQPGLIIKDVQKIRIPKGWSQKSFDLRTGVWKGERRLRAKGENADGGGRAKGPRIATTPSIIKRRPRFVARTETPPIIDGKVDGDPAWEKTPRLEAFLDTMTGFPVTGTTEVKLLWDRENIYIGVIAKDDLLQSTYKNHDDSLWKQDAFEIFLDPRGDGKDYYEFQINPAGVTFDAKLPTHRKNQNEWSSNMVVKTKMDGAINDRIQDKGWTAEILIPFKSIVPSDWDFKGEAAKWTANFFRIDIGANKTFYSAWSPPLRGDFHALDRFGQIIFVEELPKKSKRPPSPRPVAPPTNKPN